VSPDRRIDTFRHPEQREVASGIRVALPVLSTDGGGLNF